MNVKYSSKANLGRWVIWSRRKNGTCKHNSLETLQTIKVQNSFLITLNIFSSYKYNQILKIAFFFKEKNALIIALLPF